MEKNGVTRAKKAKSLSAQTVKKARKLQKKADKKAEKRERKDIKAAYTKALSKQGSDKMLAVIAILLTLAPIVAQYAVDYLDAKKKDSERE